MCGRAMSGWTVTALINDCVDELPLTVIGARLADTLSHPVASPPTSFGFYSIAVAVDEFFRDRRLRDLVLATARDPRGEVLLWGKHRPTTTKLDLTPVEISTSRAAHIFKTYALTAAGTPGSTPTFGVTETFLRALPRRR